MTQKISLPPPFSDSIPHHLHTHSHLFMKGPTPNLLNKRFFKHIHTLHLTSELELNFKTKHIKTLRTFDLTHDYWRKKVHIRRIQRFIKPRQKYLKSLKGDSKQPKIQKLLPLLTELHLGMSPAKWRPLAYSLNLKALSLEITSSAYSRSHPQENLLFQKLRTHYTGTFPRALSRLQSLKSLDITLPRDNPERIQMIFYLLRKLDLSRFRLENFNFKIISTFDEIAQPSSYVVNQGVKKAFPYIKELTLQDTKWFISIFDRHLLENLISLEVKIAPQDCIDFGNKLVTFKRLEKLKKLDFSFRAYNLLSEREFLESFTLPISLETLTLKLINMKWNETELTKRNRRKLQADFDKEQIFVLFFNQWKELKNLKNLSLTINEDTSETKRCPGLAGNFVSRIIKQINSLEHFYYSHALNGIRPQKKKGRTSPVLPVKSLDLEEFWEALTCSKSSLQSIRIEAPEVAFPLKINVLDFGFPRLKTLSLGRRILWAKELAAFSRGFPSLEKLVVRGLRFQDEERFEMFLKDIREDFEMDLSVDVEGIKYEFLKRCLTWLIHKKEIKVDFDLSLENVPQIDYEEFERDGKMYNWQGNLKNLGIIYYFGERPSFSLLNRRRIDFY